ncbi:alpha/beta fold hydrolase [Kitasatospora sp. NPDC052868]|uniref:alpha/beta fold hydrolase n=1 Tax=Kitasatospora sp. NPDC052868 TaxID=3364060 RepID=UPI0037CCAA00
MTTALLDTAGARIHHQVQGGGPVLLIAQSGEGDADRSADLVARLVDRYTVVTYDRRGLSRSPLDRPGTTPTVEEHADDVHRLLAALTDRPALMLGCSLGALIGLQLAHDHPGQLDTLIAHEPAAPRLLPTEECAGTLTALAGIQEVFHRDGWQAALRGVMAATGIDPARQEREPEVRPAPFGPEREANFASFLAHDLTTLRRSTFGLAEAGALAAGPTRVVPAIGLTTDPTVYSYRCAEVLAERLGTGLLHLPGGHNGNLTHPRAFAARLDEALTAAPQAS